MNIRTCIVGLGLLLLVTVGCGGNEQAATPAPMATPDPAAAPAPAAAQPTTVDPRNEWNKIVQFLNTATPKRYWIVNCENPSGLSQANVQSNGIYSGGGLETGKFGDKAVHSRYIEPSLANYTYDSQASTGTIEWRVYNKNVLEKQVVADGEYVTLIDRKEFMQVRCTLRYSGEWRVEKIEQKGWKEGSAEPSLYRLANNATYTGFFTKAVSSALNK